MRSRSPIHKSEGPLCKSRRIEAVHIDSDNINLIGDSPNQIDNSRARHLEAKAWRREAVLFVAAFEALSLQRAERVLTVL